MTAISRLLLSLGFLLLVVVAGCGDKVDPNLTVVKGRLVKGAEPYQAQLTGPKYPEGEGVGMAEVTAYPVKTDDEVIVDDNGDVMVQTGVQLASVKPDGTFEFKGAGQGIPKGKYRIVIQHIDPLTDKDHLKGKFNPTNSRITRDLTEGPELTIDVAKPKG